jgi:hypothetical protein
MRALGQGKVPLPKQKRNLGQMGRLVSSDFLGCFKGLKHLSLLLVLVLIILYAIPTTTMLTSNVKKE